MYISLFYYHIDQANESVNLNNMCRILIYILPKVSVYVFVVIVLELRFINIC